MHKSADYLEICKSQIPGISTRIALPLHLRSAACRFTQFATSISNFVSHRGLRSASCIVDVDWLKVCVQLVVRGREDGYRDGRLNRVFIVWTEMNP